VRKNTWLLAEFNLNRIRPQLWGTSYLWQDPTPPPTSNQFLSIFIITNLVSYCVDPWFNGHLRPHLVLLGKISLCLSGPQSWLYFVLISLGIWILVGFQNLKIFSPNH